MRTKIPKKEVFDNPALYDEIADFCITQNYILTEDDDNYVLVQNPAPKEPTIEELRKLKISELCSKSNSLMRKVHSDYTQGEIDTFEQQHQGADDILGGNETTVNAMFVVAILSGRLGHEPSEDEKIEFANRIMSNYNEAAIATANILGKQQNLVNAARSASTKKEIKAIVWED